MHDQVFTSCIMLAGSFAGAQVKIQEDGHGSLCMHGNGYHADGLWSMSSSAARSPACTGHRHRWRPWCGRNGETPWYTVHGPLTNKYVLMQS
jgi:hypothetical protein